MWNDFANCCNTIDLDTRGSCRWMDCGIGHQGENMIGGGKVLSQMAVFHIITNKVFNATMI
jgi:hypothetical protein